MGTRTREGPPPGGWPYPPHRRRCYFQLFEVLWGAWRLPARWSLKKRGQRSGLLAGLVVQKLRGRERPRWQSEKGMTEYLSDQVEHFFLYSALQLLCFLREIDLHRGMSDIEQCLLDIV